MAVNKKNIMTRYFFVVLLLSLVGIAVLVKAGVIMFAEQGYWKEVADRFIREGVPVKPNRGNILSADGKLMASSLPEYRIYMGYLFYAEVMAVFCVKVYVRGTASVQA